MNKTSLFSVPTSTKGIQPNTIVNHLDWIQGSPVLFCKSASPWITEHPLPCNISHLKFHQHQIKTLIHYLEHHSTHLLGIYYETLWQWLLKQHPDCTLLGHNIQVKIKKDKSSNNNQLSTATTTLGEFDLLYRCQEQVFHRELALKFYLGLPSALTGCNPNQPSPWHHWVGPNLNDSLDKKLYKLLNHQINLSHYSESRAVLSKLGIKALPEKEALIQGRLFYPLLHPSKNLHPKDQLENIIVTVSQNMKPITSQISPPKYSHPHHLTGCWLTISQFSPWLLSNSETSDFLLLTKLHWLNSNHTLRRVNGEDLYKIIKQQCKPLQINWIKANCSLYLFIVPDEWPDQANNTLSNCKNTSI